MAEGGKRSTLSSSDRLAQHEASAPILARCAYDAAPNAQHQTPGTHSSGRAGPPHCVQTFARAPCARPDRAPPGLLGGVTLPAPAGTTTPRTEKSFGVETILLARCALPLQCPLSADASL
jgi:hypothetical protein